MEFLYWNPWAVPGLLAMILAFAMAAFVYATHPQGTANRLLALALVAEGAAIGGGAGFIYVFENEPHAYAAQAVSVTATILLPSLYLSFLTILDTPLVRPLKTVWAQVLIWGAAAALEVYWFLRPGQFLVTPMLGPGDGIWYAQWDVADFGPTYRQIRYLALVVLLFGLIATISAYRRATAKLARDQSRAFLYAFGTRDVFQILFILLVFGRQDLGIQIDQLFFDYLTTIVFPMMIFLYVPILAYGILRTQLFDIDVKIKWTIRRGTLAFIFLGVFFVVGETAQNFFSETLGWLSGGFAAGLLLFAVAPLQRFAERLADHAMPGVKSLAEMSHPERATLYREQVQFAWSDGTLTKKERILLDHLRERLGLSSDEATRVELAVMRD